MGEHLVIFAEGIWVAEIVGEKLHGFIGHFLNERDQLHHVGVQALDAIQVHRNVIVGVLAHIFLVRAHHETEQVGRQQFASVKVGYFVIAWQIALEF